MSIWRTSFLTEKTPKNANREAMVWGVLFVLINTEPWPQHRTWLSLLPALKLILNILLTDFNFGAYAGSALLKGVLSFHIVVLTFVFCHVPISQHFFKNLTTQRYFSSFYCEIFVISQQVANNVQGSLCDLHPFLPVITSYITLVQYDHQENDIHTIHRAFAGFFSFPCTHLCVWI